MGKKILLADDSITIQKVIELTFSDEDFEVVTVGNGRLAIERVLDVRPDIVLCDIIMPEKDGYEVCDFIKKTPTLAHVPVLLLTGAFEPFDQERAARVGCDGFLAKPFEPQTLIAKVKELLTQATGRPVVAAPRAVPAAAPPPPAAPPVAPAYADEVVEEPEPMSVFDEPEPTAPTDSAESDASFIPDEPFLEYAETPAAETAAEATIPPLLPSAGDAAMEQDLYGVVDAVDAAPDELLTVTPEESASLGGAPSEPDASSTVIFRGGAPAPWKETMEVSLETRARAGVEHIQRDNDAGIFEEVFEEETLNMKGPVLPEGEEPPVAELEDELAADVPEPLVPGEEEEPWEPMAELDSSLQPEPAVPESPFASPAVSAPEPEEATRPSYTPPIYAPPPPARVSAEPPPPAPAPVAPAPIAAAFTPVPVSAPVPPPEPAAEPTMPSFADVQPFEQEAPLSSATASSAAEASVPVDMVAQIAQRVVAQISEKVVREIAWEVIPDLAEALIKKEIERLKAELQHT
jgi:CheY-like chemotaxis protein